MHSEAHMEIRRNKTTQYVLCICLGSALTFELITVLQLKQSCCCGDTGSVSIPTLLPAPFILITCLAVFLHQADCYPITFILHNVNPLWPGNLNRLWCGFDAMHKVWPHCFCAVARGALASPYGGSCDDLWGNLTLKRMQMRQRINIQRRSLVDLSRCKAISIEDINIQQKRAGTQNNTVSKTTTQRVKQKQNKSILMEAP